MVPQFSAVRFLPFLAHMWPCSVIFLVLEGHIVSHFCPNMPLGVVKDGKKENLLIHQTLPEAQRTQWGRVEWAGAELNGINT